MKIKTFGKYEELDIWAKNHRPYDQRHRTTETRFWHDIDKQAAKKFTDDMDDYLDWLTLLGKHLFFRSVVVFAKVWRKVLDILEAWVTDEADRFKEAMK